MKPYNHKIFALLDSVPPKAIKRWINLHNKIIDYTAEFPEGYLVELKAQEKIELVENFDRFNILKHSTALPKAFTEKHQQGQTPIDAVKRFIQTLAVIPIEHLKNYYSFA